MIDIPRLPRAATLARIDEPDQQTFEELEQGIAELSHRGRVPAPVILPAAPSEDVGRLSAEAAQAQIEATAKCVELMSNEAKEQDAKLEDARKELNEALKLIAKAAEQLREKGKAVYARIEEANATSKAIRDACVEVMKKADTL
jgi:predicted ribosome quality control (RQC) complex YloA/Tae2 family protein